MARTLKIAPTGADEAELLQGEAMPPLPAGGSRLGSILVQLGRLSSQHIEQVLAQQSQASPRRFGEVAMALGLVERADIDMALAHQFEIDFAPVAEVPGADAAVPGWRHDAQGEVLRAVRSQLLLRWFSGEPEQRTLAVLSHGPGEGRTHVCAHLGVLLSQLDEDTLVIDADLRKPALHALFGVDNRTGLSSYLAQQVQRAPVRAVPGHPHLHVLTAGPVLPEGTALLERRQFGLLLGRLVQRYAYVLIDTPPAAQHGEAITAAVRASGCLLVTRRHRTRLQDVQRLADQLGRHSVEVLGALINER
jgi:protein-tyrosine kinase